MNSHTSIADIARGYRELADFLEQHLDELPEDTNRYSKSNNGVCVDTAEAIATVVKCGGSWKKNFIASNAFVTREFAGGVAFWAAVSREQICERGTEIIPARPEQVVEKVEWRCTDSLLSASS